MCGRFTLITTPGAVEDVFSVIDLDPFPERYNIAPTQPVLVVVSAPSREPGSNLPDRQAVLVRWGLIPSWAKNPADMPLMINARAETVGEKAAFKTALRHRRVLVPTTGFYEWRREGKTRQPFFIRPKGGGLIAFAGLMESFSEPGGSEIDTAAILTTSANTALADIHDRMPVVIRREDFARWLDCLTQEPRDVVDLLRPVQPDFFEAIPVSDRVNKVANLGPDLIERVEDPVVAPQPKPKKKNEDQDQLRLF
ncbi:SOS response-associated peptidase [Tianweitania sp. BSSL-BM11]|uniref:Abasic site processing protein n=1 Tax=Tianweitania aestuarii TaxID=2814886 RepID=A0ABS5RUJ9_9HYPH|nr:SOS response-associated peptidase [Tianweitania aestuarii]MBS9719956.1 SOS response-associated peptidase [Tianweitania aestuarii]